MRTKKFTLIFVLINILLLAAVVFFIVSNFSLSGNINDQGKMIKILNMQIDSLHTINNDLSLSVQNTDSQIEQLRKIKENSFPEFAKRFIARVKNSENLLQNTESNILVSNIDGDKMFNNYIACSNIDYYKNKKTKVGKDQIYFYELIYEYSDKGSEQGITLYFRKGNNGNYKLYKMSIEGC